MRIIRRGNVYKLRLLSFAEVGYLYILTNNIDSFKMLLKAMILFYFKLILSQIYLQCENYKSKHLTVSRILKYLTVFLRITN